MPEIDFVNLIKPPKDYTPIVCESSMDNKQPDFDKIKREGVTVACDRCGMHILYEKSLWERKLRGSKYTNGFVIEGCPHCGYPVTLHEVTDENQKDVQGKNAEKKGSES